MCKGKAFVPMQRSDIAACRRSSTVMPMFIRRIAARSALLISTFVVAALSSAASTASAHILVTEPEPRMPGETNLKDSPCGVRPFGGPATVWGEEEGDIWTFAPGEQVTIVWEETIRHAGYFRVALGLNGDASLAVPSEDAFNAFRAYYDPGTVDSPTVPEPLEDPSGVADGDMLIYYDYYASHGGGTCAGDADPANPCLYAVTVTLPDECEKCTLQVVQAMTEGSRTYGMTSHYYQCIDLVIDPTLGPPGEEPIGDAGAAGSDDELPNEMNGTGAMPGMAPNDNPIQGAGGETAMPAPTPSQQEMPTEPPVPSEPPTTSPSAAATSTPNDSPGVPTVSDMPLPTASSNPTIEPAMPSGSAPPVTPPAAAMSDDSSAEANGCTVSTPGSANGRSSTGVLAWLAVCLATTLRRRRAV